MDHKLVNRIKASLLKGLGNVRLFSQSKAFIENAFDNMHDAISIIDTRTMSILYANKKFIETYSQKNFGVLGKKCYDVTHRSNMPCSSPNEICPLHEVARTSKHFITEHLHTDKNGMRQYVEVSASPITFNKKGEVATVIHITRDITERKQMMDRLTESYKHLGNINRKLSLILDLDRQLQEKNSKEALQYIISVANSISRAFFISLYKIGKNGQSRLLVSTESNKQTERTLKTLSPENTGIFSTLSATKKILHGSTDDYDLGLFSENPKLRYFIAIPLIKNKADTFRGFLFFGFTEKQRLSTQELDFYEVFAHQIASFLF